MFYEPSKQNHRLINDPFKSLIIPRPIGWISSQDRKGNINLAPYSYFNALCDDPPMIMFSTTNSRNDGSLKDTIHNVETQGEFVVNMVTYLLRDAVNISSANLQPDKNEFDFANLTTIPSTLVKPPRVQESPIHLECVYHQSIQLPSNKNNDTNRMVIGKVVGIHIDDKVIVNGHVDVNKIQPLARLGYNQYTYIENIFSMHRPSVNSD